MIILTGCIINKQVDALLRIIIIVNVNSVAFRKKKVNEGEQITQCDVMCGYA